MKKSTGVLTAVAVAVVAYVGTSWYMGKQVQQYIEHAVAQANEGMAQGLLSPPVEHGTKLTIAEYRRHVFSTDVVYSLQVQGTEGERHEFLLSDHLQHGPFPVAAALAGDLSPMLAFSRSTLLPSAATQSWFDHLNGMSPLSGITKIKFGRSAVSDWNFKPLNVAKDGQVLKFSGGDVHVSVSDGFAESSMIGGFDHFNYSSDSDAERIAINDIAFEYAATAGENAKSMTASTGVDGLRIEASGEESLVVEGFEMQLSSQQTGDIVKGSMRYDLGKTRASGVELGSLTIGAAIRDLSVPAFSQMLEFYDGLSKRHGYDSENWDLSADEVTQLQDNVAALLATDPVVSIAPLVWANEQGQSLAKLTVELTRPDADADGSFDLLLQQIVRALNLEFKIEKAMFVEALTRLQTDEDADEAAAFSAALYDDYANRLQTAGMAVVTDGVATANIAYRDGQVNANGKAMGVSEFLQRALIAFLM